MNISLYLILTKLKINYPSLKVSDIKFLNSPKLNGIKNMLMQKEFLNPNYLYVCNSEHPFLKNNIPEYLLLLCVHKNKIPASKKNKSVLYLQTKLESAYIFNELQDIYSSFREWEHSLDLCLLKKGNVQDIITLSEPIINAPIILYDLGLKVLGYTSIVPSDDFLFNTTIKKGFLPSGAFKAFDSTGDIFEKLNLEGIVSTPPNKFKESADIIYRLRSKDTSYGYCTLITESEDFIDYMKLLFDVVCDKLTQCLEATHHSRLTQNFMHEYIIEDLLKSKFADEESVREKFEYFNLPFNSNFYILKIAIQEESTIRTEHLISVLSNTLTDALIFSYINNPCILLHFPLDYSEKKVSSLLKKTLVTISSELSGMNAKIGISNLFYKASELRTGYMQADAATSISFRITSNCKSDIYCFYKDFYLFHIFELCKSEISLLSFCHLELLKLKDDKGAKSNNYFEMIGTFLECNCNITATAEKLFMHRNNIVYHIKHIESLYNLDFNNSQERFHMLLTYKILKFL